MIDDQHNMFIIRPQKEVPQMVDHRASPPLPVVFFSSLLWLKQASPKHCVTNVAYDYQHLCKQHGYTASMEYRGAGWRGRHYTLREIRRRMACGACFCGLKRSHVTCCVHLVTIKGQDMHCTHCSTFYESSFGYIPVKMSTPDISIIVTFTTFKF